MASLHPGKLTLEPLGWGPSNSLESSSRRLQQHPQVNPGASDGPTGQPWGVLGERTRKTGRFCPSGLVQAGTLSAWSYVAPSLQMMKQLRKGPGHTQVAEPGHTHGRRPLRLRTSCRIAEGPGSPQCLSGRCGRGGARPGAKGSQSLRTASRPAWKLVSFYRRRKGVFRTMKSVAPSHLTLKLRHRGSNRGLCLSALRCVSGRDLSFLTSP